MYASFLVEIEHGVVPKEELKIFGKFGESPSYVCSLLVVG